MAAFVRPQTAQQAVLADLRRAIRQGELTPGEQIVQETLAERYGLSRIPVRDALRILEGEGQVTYRPHHGYFVTKLDIEELLETYRMRALLESDAAAAAVPLISEEQILSMERAAAALDAAASHENLIDMMEANRRFHFTLLEASGLTRMLRIIEQLWDSTDPYRSLYYAESEHRERVLQEHLAIVDAVRRRDVPVTVRMLDEHRTHAIESLKIALQSGKLPPSDAPSK